MSVNGNATGGNTDPEKVFTIRLEQDQADMLEMCARVRRSSSAAEIRAAIAARIEELRHDEEFQRRLKESIERDRELLNRLAQT